MMRTTTPQTSRKIPRTEVGMRSREESVSAAVIRKRKPACDSCDGRDNSGNCEHAIAQPPSKQILRKQHVPFFVGAAFFL